MNSGRDLIRNFILLFCGCVVAIIAAEVFLRIYHPFEFRVRGDRIILPANKSYIFDNTALEGVDKKIIHRKNSLGFRGEEAPKNFEKHLTIVTIGGSTTECFYLSDGRTWPDRLGKKLEDGFNDVWINNAGLDGHSTFGHMVLMQDYIVKLKPKIAIFLIGANDMEINDPSIWDRRNISGGEGPGKAKCALTRLCEKSELFSLLLNLARYAKTRTARLGHEGIDLLNTESLDINQADREKTLDLHKTKYLLGYETRLKKLIRISRDSGIEPVFVTQSALFGDTVDKGTDVDLGRIKIGAINGSLQWEILELYNSVTRKVAAEEGILCIDLAEEMPKDTKYYYDLYHYNNLGAQKSAEIIHGRLEPFLLKRYGEYAKK